MKNLIYALVVYRETIRWNHVVSMLLVVAAVFFAFLGKSDKINTDDASPANSPALAAQTN